MFSLDLKSGYHHIEISEQHPTFLGFSWRTPDFEGKVFYVFTVLPFGLSTAPFIFTRLLKPLEKHWRSQGIFIAIFLDDGWRTVQDQQGRCITAHAVKKYLASAGFITNEEKSTWVPAQVLKCYYDEICIFPF